MNGGKTIHIYMGFFDCSDTFEKVAYFFGLDSVGLFHFYLYPQHKRKSKGK